MIINGSQFGYSAGHYYYSLYLKDYFEIHYVCYDRGLDKLRLDGVTVEYIAFETGKIKRLFSLIRQSISKSKKINPDLLFVVYFNHCFLLPLFCRYKTSLLDIRTGSLHKNAAQRKLSNRLLALQSLLFKKKIILSESLRLKLGIRNRNTLILPLGSEVYFKGEHTYEQLHLLYVGVFDGRNIADTIYGLSDYLQKYPDRKIHTRFTIVGFGSGAEETSLVNLVNTLKLNSVVSFEGRKNYNELQPYFKNANIGVSYVPITDYYNWQPPTKTFEYILSGLFTIATATYENRRLINPTNGLTCTDTPAAFANALGRCYELRHDFNSQEIRETLSDYKWSSIVEYKLKPFLIGK